MKIKSLVLALSVFLLCAPFTQAEAWTPPLEAEWVFRGEIVSVQSGPVGMSEPPLYTWRLRVRPLESFRGATPGNAAEEPVQLHYSYRGHQRPEFAAGQEKIFAVQSQQDSQVILVMVPKENVDLDALRQKDFPGWTREADGSWKSPWGDARTPAALPEGVQFTVTPVKPVREIQWTNPDGDGWFRLTLRNEGPDTVRIPALPVREGEILWENAVLITIQDKVYTVPGVDYSLENTESLNLKPGEEVSGTVNALRVRGPEWPRGGSRIGIGFILADQVRTHSFYYMSRHHDSLRE